MSLNDSNELVKRLERKIKGFKLSWIVSNDQSMGIIFSFGWYVFSQLFFLLFKLFLTKSGVLLNSIVTLLNYTYFE